ncbi:hypothetical protein SynBIOSE41_01548 [Synechococcus sp. BIOS-E4-1]|nr:hypothetical protein SynBIOSE41_01548 [Synechococcus sp. BIOS-E4-1]
MAMVGIDSLVHSIQPAIYKRMRWIDHAEICEIDRPKQLS